MQSIVLQADTLNLPPVFAGRYSGRSLRIVDEGERLVLTPVQTKQVMNIIESARGMLNGLNYSTEDFMREKQMEKDRENA